MICIKIGRPVWWILPQNRSQWLKRFQSNHIIPNMSIVKKIQCIINLKQNNFQNRLFNSTTYILKCTYSSELNFTGKTSSFGHQFPTPLCHFCVSFYTPYSIQWKLMTLIEQERGNPPCVTFHRMRKNSKKVRVSSNWWNWIGVNSKRTMQKHAAILPCLD